MTTHAALTLTAQTLSDARKGTFTGLITRKVGTVRGGLRYGDDLVHVVIVTGFRYDNLVAKSREMLQSMDPAALVADFASKGIVDGKGQPIRLADVCKAVADLDASFRKSLEGTNESTTDHVFEPLVIDGEVVRGARVYKCVASQGIKCHCRTCTGNPKAPVDGQINLSGLKIGETVIESATNGPVPAAKSRADVVAKNVIRARLPVGRYVSYRLEPGGDYLLRVGGTAALAATKDGVTADPKRVKATLTLLKG